MLPSNSPFGEMVPGQSQQKEKNAILEEIQKSKRQEEILKSMRKGNPNPLQLQQHQLKSSSGNLLGSPHALIFESQKLKHMKKSPPQSSVKLAQELPNHKVTKDTF